MLESSNGLGHVANKMISVGKWNLTAEFSNEIPIPKWGFESLFQLLQGGVVAAHVATNKISDMELYSNF